MLMCEDSIDIPEYRKELLSKIAASPDDLESMAELVCADCLICEENVKDFGPAWKNSVFVNEILEYAPVLLKEKEKGYGNIVFNACDRVNDVLFNHPRLKVKLLKLELKALDTSKDIDGDKQETRKGIEKKIEFLEINIKRADMGNLEQCENIGMLKRDPVEWTAEYEKVIDEAEEKANAELADVPRGMGFCHAYWHSLANILFEDYGIVWRSPAMMNPGVMFD